MEVMETNNIDCPICLDEMTEIDQTHPLQCSSPKCFYNFCQHCIESLLDAYKDPYEEASDGNLHVKIFLYCPSCRSDLSKSIRDTLLLRKFDTVLTAKDDTVLSASQLRLRKVIDDCEIKVQEAIKEARIREANFFGREIEEDLEYEEIGVEADLLMGVHNSMRYPKAAPIDRCEDVETDCTLFSGLGYFLSEEEQHFITQGLTSGRPEELVVASQLLHTISNNHAKKGNLLPEKSKRSSVFQLIRENEHAIVGKKKTKARNSRSLTIFKKLYPLPVRMPKYVKLVSIKDLDFCNFSWNGTVMDAYSKISIEKKRNGKYEVTQKKTSNLGVRNVLKRGDARVEMPNQPRVLIFKVNEEAGLQGIMKGDVLTHIDGTCISGKSVESINWPDESNHIVLVFNAESSVSEALKRRALAIKDSLQYMNNF